MKRTNYVHEINETDRQTDRQMQTDNMCGPLIYLAWRGLVLLP